jgi:radical SAM protein with 4Fe4S-binding SPASM domain
MRHASPLEEKLASISLVADGAMEGALSTEYIDLAGLMLQEGRVDEAATSLMAAQFHARPEMQQPIAQEVRRLVGMVPDSGGILSEHAQFLSMRNKYSEFPSVIQLETLSTCNAACLFCPYPAMDRKGEKMPDELLYKLLRDLKDIPRDHQFTLAFHHISEPFLDKRFKANVEWCQEHLPNANITVTTNGAALNEANVRFLLSARNVRDIQISFNDHRSQEYAFAMKLPYERTLANIDRLHDLMAEYDRTPVTVRRVGDGSEADAEFVKFCRARWRRFSSVSKKAKDFLGQIEQGPTGQPIEQLTYSEVPISGCAQWYQMIITSSGKLAACCFDGKAEWVIGDVSEKHLLDVYNSETMRKFRTEIATRLEAPEPCRSCTIFWSGRKMNPFGEIAAE